MDCWEFKHCAPVVRDTCPAHPDRGRVCWKVTGTKCDGGVVEKASLAEKIDFCRRCAFYQTHAQKF
jgi:hypothetical protein